MYIETNITNAGNLRLKWFNGTETFIPMQNTSDMWFITMENLENQSWVTFEIWSDTSMVVNWTKPSLNHPLVGAGQTKLERKYVSFGCTPQPVDYQLFYLDTIPYYNSVYRHCIASGGNVYECMMAEYYGGGRESGIPASLTGYDWERGDLFRGGITNGESYDTGVLNAERGTHNANNNKIILPDGYVLPAGEIPSTSHADGVPQGTDQYRYCFAFLNFWWNESMIPSNGISNYYARYWHSDDWFSVYFWKPQDDRFDFISLFKWQFDTVTATRDFSAFPETKITIKNDVLSVPASTFDSSYGESLGVYYKSFPEISLDESDSEVYEFGFQLDGQWPNVQVGEHQQAFVIFNLPDNATLQGMDSDSDGLNDYAELFIYYTNPKNANTDEGSLNDGQEVALGKNPNLWNDDYVPPAPPKRYVTGNVILGGILPAIIGVGIFIMILFALVGGFSTNPKEAIAEIMVMIVVILALAFGLSVYLGM
jgi:hypothetical protein